MLACEAVTKATGTAEGYASAGEATMGFPAEMYKIGPIIRKSISLKYEAVAPAVTDHCFPHASGK